MIKKSMKQLGNFLKMIDQFGIKTELKFDSKIKFTTNIGGAFTIIYITIFIILFISSGTDMINHSNPNSSFSKIYVPFPEVLNFSKNGYFFVFGLQNNQFSHYYDESIYNVTFVIESFNSSVPYVPTYTNIPFERCKVDNLPLNEDLRDSFMKLADNISDLLCFKNDLDGAIGIKGTWDNLDYVDIQININKCSNSSDPNKPICKSQEEIDSAIKGGYFAFYSTETIIDTQIYNNPGKKNVYDYYTPISSAIKRSLFRYLSSTYLMSDNGWITQNLEMTTYGNLDSDKEYFDIVNDSTSNEYFMSMIIRKSSYDYIYKRDYKKVQTVLAEMGGFLKISFMVFNFLAYIFSNHIYFEKISNELYNFQRNSDEDDVVSAKEVELRKAFEKEKAPILFQNSEDNIMQAADDEKLIKYFEKLKEKPLGMSFCDYLKSFCINDHFLLTKKKQRMKAVGEILSRFDIKYILKKFLEIDKIKCLLFNSDQMQIYQNLPKPLINMKAKLNINPMDMNNNNISHRISTVLIVHQEKILRKINVFKKCFSNILRKTELDDIDKKLINFMGEDLKSILGISDFNRLKTRLTLSERQHSLSINEIKIMSNDNYKD